jgi:hypothetical protein
MWCNVKLDVSYPHCLICIRANVSWWDWVLVKLTGYICRAENSFKSQISTRLSLPGDPMYIISDSCAYMYMNSQHDPGCDAYTYIIL